jgi:hypothetical protein
MTRPHVPAETRLRRSGLERYPQISCCGSCVPIKELASLEHRMHRDRQFARYGNGGAFEADPFAKLQAPCAQEDSPRRKSCPPRSIDRTSIHIELCARIAIQDPAQIAALRNSGHSRAYRRLLLRPSRLLTSMRHALRYKVSAAYDVRSKTSLTLAASCSSEAGFCSRFTPGSSTPL